MGEHPAERPWRDEETLRKLYETKGMSIEAIADELGCSHQTIRRYIKENGMELPLDKYKDERYRDKSTLEELYKEQELTIEEIADKFDSDNATIHYWLDKFDIETRPRMGPGRDSSTWREFARMVVSNDGYVEWVDHFHNQSSHVGVHRLLAVSEYGFEEVSGKDVHHEIEIPWLNTPDNVVPMGRSEHRRLHFDLND